ncbi:MAG: hypothetical protein H6926_03495 [Chromatiales bacterium]|nr:hypothetical protein [Gammaproteobacteria bacterium]MCP5352239.1 hypothetical protein [Chromatiales bacterium]
MNLRSLAALCAAALLPLTANADRLCDAQGEALITRFAADVTPAPSREQLDQMRGIAQELCEAQTAQTGAPPAPEGYADWFTYFMLNKQPEKAGNKRLKSLK